MGWWGETETRCMGRFCLDVPKAMSCGGGYGMQGVALEEVIWPEPREGAFQHAWKERLRQIADLASDRAYPGDIAGTVVEQRSFREGFNGIYYLPEVEQEGKWTGLLDLGRSGLWFDGAELVKRKDRLTSSIAAIGVAYRLRKPGEVWPVPGVDYFYLDDGLVALSYGGREHSFTKLDGLDLNLTIESRSVAEAEEQTLMQGVGKMFQAAVGMGASDIPAPAKHGSRVVAGMRGEELLLRSQAEGKLYFQWLFRGEPDSGKHPRIEIEMEAHTEGDKEKKARELWDALLDSMRPAAGR